jgi:AcrR family transcriptional regulator
MDDALKQLHDLHLPEAPGLWPPAPGWWILGICIVAALTVLAIRLYRSRRRSRPLRLAVGALDQLLAANRDRRLSPRDFANAVNDLLKRALIHGARRFDAAPLTGAAWLAYLDGIVASDVFSNGAGAALGLRRFAPDFQPDPDALHAAARDVLNAVKKQAPR